VALLEFDAQGLGLTGLFGRLLQGLNEREECPMGFPFFGVDSPGGVGVAIDRLIDGPTALLIEVRFGGGDCEIAGGSFRGDYLLEPDFVEVEVAIIGLATGALMREGGIGEEVELECGDRGLPGTNDQGVGFDIGELAGFSAGPGGEEGPVGERLEGGPVGGFNFDDFDGLRLIEESECLLLPGGNFGLKVGREERGIGGLDAFGEGGEGGFQLPAAGGDFRVRIEGAIGFIGGGENGLQAVVISLGDGIELVIVAACAMNGTAGESRDDRSDDIVAIEVLSDDPVDGIFADIAEGTFVPGTRGEETGGDEGCGIAREKDVAGDLFPNEAGVGFVGIEGLNEVVAIGPDVIPNAVLVVTMRFGIVYEIHPVSGLTFAEAGIVQKAIDDTFIGIELIVSEEVREVLGSGRHTDEVDGDAAEEGPFVGGRSVSKLTFPMFPEDETINGIVRPFHVS